MGIFGASSNMQIVAPKGTYLFTFQSGDVYKEALNCEEDWSSQHIDGASIFLSFSDVEKTIFFNQKNLTTALSSGFFGIPKLLLSHTFNDRKEGHLLKSRGAAPFIKFEPWSYFGPNDNSYPIKQANAGAFDYIIEKHYRELGSYGGPVLATDGHEMNGDWYPWGTKHVTQQESIDYFNHVGAIIQRVAPNVTHVWNPDLGGADPINYYPGKADFTKLTGTTASVINIRSTLITAGYIDNNDIVRPKFNGDRSDFVLPASISSTDADTIFSFLHKYDHVKFVLVDAYDWDGTNTFESLIIPRLMALDAQINGSAAPQDRIPIGVGEFGTAATDKSAFLTNMVDTIADPRYADASGNPLIKIVMYFNVNKESKWKISSTADRAALATAYNAHANLFQENIITRGGELSDSGFGKRKVEPEMCLAIDRQRFLAREELNTYKKTEYCTTTQVAMTDFSNGKYGVFTPEGSTNDARLNQAKCFINQATYQEIETDSNIQYLRAVERLGMLPPTISSPYLPADLWTIPDPLNRENAYKDAIVQYQAAYAAKPYFPLPEETFGMEGSSGRRVPERRRIFKYFDILLEGADTLAQVSPDSSLLLCERVIGKYEQLITIPKPVDGFWPALRRLIVPSRYVVKSPNPHQGTATNPIELYDPSFKRGHAIKKTSMPGYEARARMLMAWNYQKKGAAYENTALSLYDLVIDWSDRELKYLTVKDLTFVNSFYLKGVKQTSRNNVLYISSRARLGKSELPNITNPSDGIDLISKVLTWEQVGKRTGPMDLAERAIIGALEICLPSNNDRLFNRLPWSTIDNYADLKSTLQLSGVDLTTLPQRMLRINKNLMTIKNSLPPDLRKRLELLNTDPRVMVNMRGLK